MGGLIVALVLSACTSSQIDPDADVSIQGTMVDPSGAAVAGGRVALWRQPDLGQGFATAMTFGLACLSQEIPDACEGVRTTSTGDDGSYRFDLKGRDTQGSVGNASTLELTGHYEPADGEFGGPVTSLRFIAQVEQLTMPLRGWQPAIAIEQAGRSIRAGWDALPANVLPAGSPGDARLDLRFEAAADEVVWTQRVTGMQATFDARVLEDARGTVVVAASADSLPVPEQRGTKLGFTVRSGERPFVGPAGAPASRGASCSTGSSFRQAAALSPCPVTDGIFAPTPIAGNARALTIDLGEAIRQRYIVVRGCRSTCVVQTSSNGSTWKGLGRGEDLTFAIAPGVPPRARYLRVSGEDADNLTEVSVWDRAARAGTGTLLATPDEHTAATGDRVINLPGQSSGTPWGIFVLVVIIAVAAYMFGRGRRRA